MKSTYFIKVKAFLQRNKILFDIFSSILLSSMALIVSINSCQISKQQSINEERLNIPLIKVSSEQFSNKETNDSEKITIENVGGYAYNYKIQKKVFLSCEYNPLNGEATKQIYLPIDDILDTSIVGNICDEYDGEEEQSITKINDSTFTFDGFADIDDVSKALGIQIPDGDYDTIAGFVITLLGYLPSEDDKKVHTVKYDNLVFTVLDVKDRRIGKIKVEKVEVEK